ncbi:MAG: leucyl aminopeptidase [Proteobacteria bacterium]|nr:leucyl aminopeptidase [Burkholderiales bacterium]
MEFSIKTGSPEKLKSGCAVVGVFQSSELSTSALAIDKAIRGALSEIVKRGDFEGKPGTTLLVSRVDGRVFERVLLVGLGPESEFREKAYREAVRSAVVALRQTGARDALLCLTETPIPGRSTAWAITQAVVIAMEALYRFDAMKSQPERTRMVLRSIALKVSARGNADAEAALAQGVATAHGMNLAKDLGNLPPNVCTPTYLAEQAELLARDHRMKLEVLEQKDMQRLGMGALLAVARGSRQPPKLIALSWQGAPRKTPPLVMIGKGITFDTGGISLKSAPEMDEMKFDMCGAASVLGTMKAVALMKLPLNVIGIVSAAENMPDGNATRPGDIVTTMSGQTVEILNTDAEGRLVLCDAMTWCERFEPALVIDIATLTGACVIALGHVASGLYANNDALARDVQQAGDAAWDRVWPMPLWDDYQEQLKSNFADFANIGGRPAGSVTAACYLARFAKKFAWAHLDIAGTAWKSGREKGATGRPVPLLTEFLAARARATHG